MKNIRVCVAFGVFCFLNFLEAAPCGPTDRCVTRSHCRENDWSNLKLCDSSKRCCPANKLSFDSGRAESSYSSLDFSQTQRPSRSFHSLSPAARDFLGTYNYNGECGVRKVRHGRVSTGHSFDSGLASYGEFPWQAAIFLRTDRRKDKQHYINAYKYHCGGAVISDRAIVTAAHCVHGVRKENLKIKLGEHNLQGIAGEVFPPLERNVVRKIVHENYNPNKLIHDIAVLVLDRPVYFPQTPHISPVCLPPRDFKFEKYEKCFITGFGEDVFNPNYGSNILKVASVTLHADDQCKDLLESAVRYLSAGFYHESHQCFTGGEGRDACIGDGGGAVVCPVSNHKVPVCRSGFGCEPHHYFIAGVISWGSEHCGQENSVSVMADMVHHRDWLMNALRQTDRREAHGHPFFGTVDRRPGRYEQEGFGENVRYNQPSSYSHYGPPRESYNQRQNGRYPQQFNQHDTPRRFDHNNYGTVIPESSHHKHRHHHEEH